QWGEWQGQDAAAGSTVSARRDEGPARGRRPQEAVPRECRLRVTGRAASEAAHVGRVVPARVRGHGSCRRACRAHSLTAKDAIEREDRDDLTGRKQRAIERRIWRK